MRIKAGANLVACLTAAGICLSALAALAQEKRNIRIVTVSLGWNAALPFRVALARGLFKQQGLQVEPILIRGGPAAIAALVSGEVDYAGIGGAQAAFRSRARGLDVSIIGCTSSTTSYLLLGNNNKVVYFIGNEDKPLEGPALTGFGKGSLDKIITAHVNAKKDTSEYLIVIVKPSDRSTYKNFVATIDLINACKVKSWGVVDISPKGVDMLKSMKAY